MCRDGGRQVRQLIQIMFVNFSKKYIYHLVFILLQLLHSRSQILSTVFYATVKPIVWQISQEASVFQDLPPHLCNVCIFPNLLDVFLLFLSSLSCIICSAEIISMCLGYDLLFCFQGVTWSSPM